MNFLKITSHTDPYFNAAMAIYTASFPLFEQRTLKDQIEALKDYHYRYIAVCENDDLIAILLYWEMQHSIYIEHLAVSPALRGQNYGTKILQSFCQTNFYEKNKDIILEIDPPIDNVSIQRLNFYSKLGFKLQPFTHVHPPYRQGYTGHPLKVLSFSQDISPITYNLFNTYLKSYIMTYSECSHS